MDLHGIGDLAPQRASEDHRSHDQVVGERDLGAYARPQLAHGGHVGGDIGGDLRFAAVGEGARFDPLVAVGHIDGEQAADVGPVDGAAPRGRGRGGAGARPAGLAHLELARVPVAEGVDEGLLLGMAVLAEQVHLVPETRERLG